MSWHYRVRRHDYAGMGEEFAYEIIEYYPEINGVPAWSDPLNPYGDTLDDLIAELRRMLRAARKAKRHPGLVFEEKEERSV